MLNVPICTPHQVHSDGYISLQAISENSSDSVIAVFLSDVDTSGTGGIFYE